MARNKPLGSPDLPPAPPQQRVTPQSPEAEEGVLGCCLLEPSLIGEHCRFLTADAFQDLRRGLIWKTMKEMWEKRQIVNVLQLRETLVKRKLLDDCGGLAYLNGLSADVPSAANLPYYLDILLEKYAARKVKEVCESTIDRIYEWEGDFDSLMLGIQADMETVSRLRAASQKPALKIWNVNELVKWEAPAHLRLVGDNEICMGYEGMTLIAGPGASGKSLVAVSLALAGAIGSGTWMGRQVHRQFKTLIIQAENGPVRLKNEVMEMRRLHPKVPIQDHIFISEPPEGGLPFHRPEFRAAVREQIALIKPSLVILDTYAAMAVEDSAKDVIDKLGEVRSTFPAGDQCPGMMIIAHTKKPRPEDVRRGRALTNQVVGSVALPNSARCVYMLLPWNEELEEDRVYWACPKLNNGKMYPPSVWRRRMGTFFEHDPDTDPRTWGQEEPKTGDRALEEGDLRAAFGTEHVLPRRTLVKRLEENLGVAENTIYRILKPPDGYLAHLVEITPEGWVKLKAGNGK